jgi:hypothetical protein
MAVHLSDGRHWLFSCYLMPRFPINDSKLIPHSLFSCVIFRQLHVVLYLKMGRKFTHSGKVPKTGQTRPFSDKLMTSWS